MRARTALGASLALALALTAGAFAPWEPMPPRVREMCGELPVAEESLCNVHEELRDAYLLVERIVGEEGDDVPDRARAMVRDRLVTVEWLHGADPTSVRAGLAGMYAESSHQVLLPQGLRSEPLRVRASVVAHELGHAALLYDNVSAGLRPAELCLDHEARAYKVGIRAYDRARQLVQEPPGDEGSVDRHLADEMAMWQRLSGGDSLTAAGLDDLATRHVFIHGYAVDCNWRERVGVGRA
ncbi:MAG: hypothetical protein U0893_02305 [Chloroflexota bacterium]